MFSLYSMRTYPLTIERWSIDSTGQLIVIYSTSIRLLDLHLGIVTGFDEYKRPIVYSRYSEEV